MTMEVYPVVHINDESQAVNQALAALDRQADGVYLIDHHTSHGTYLLRSVFNDISAEAPGKFIGVNILQKPDPLEAFQFIQQMSESGDLSRLPDGLWVDDASYTLFSTEAFRAAHQELKSVLYLGGVAFKYTELYTDSPVTAAEYAKLFRPFVDIVTTTGSQTGRAVTIDKVAAMKRAITPQKLAVASGVSIENISEITNIADQALVASSIETYPSSGIFDLSKLGELILMAHE